MSFPGLGILRSFKFGKNNSQLLVHLSRYTRDSSRSNFQARLRIVLSSSFKLSRNSFDKWPGCNQNELKMFFHKKKPEGGVERSIYNFWHNGEIWCPKLKNRSGRASDMYRLSEIVPHRVIYPDSAPGVAYIKCRHTAWGRGERY